MMWLKKLFKRVTRKIVSSEYVDEIMTISYDDGSRDKYIGSSTVWHKLPDFKRCGTMTESWLADLYTKHKHLK